jgi:PAS domain S-box-containing protein
MDTEDELATISDLRQQLAALEQREERFRLAVESSRDGMWDWNVVTGEVYYSPRWLEVLGYRDSDIAPDVSTWERLLHPDDMAHVMTALQRHLANESAWYEVEFRLRTGSGAWLWAHDRGKVVMRDAQGAPHTGG